MEEQSEASASSTPEETSNDSDKPGQTHTVIHNGNPEETDFIGNEDVENDNSQLSKRRLSSSDDDESWNASKIAGGFVDETDQSAGDDNDVSCNDEDDSSHSDGSDDSADDPQVLDDILSVKKMELLQHPQVIAFLQEKIDQAKQKGK